MPSKTNVIQMPRKTCPRCDAPTQGAGKGIACTLCTWPNPSWVRVVTTLARRGADASGRIISDEGLEEFAASIQSHTTLTDAQGQQVTAKVVQVVVENGEVNVTFEFDPKGWKKPK